MKIAFVHHSLQVSNGTDSLVYQYANKLSEKGHEVVVYTLKASGTNFGGPNFGIHRTKLPFGNGRLNTSVFAPIYRQFWKVRKELQGYDAVISMIYPSCLLPVWPEKLNTKTIHIEWGTPEGVWSNTGERLYSKIAKVSQGIACMRADKVLVPGPFIKNWVKENYSIEAKQIYLDGIDFGQVGEEEPRYDTRNILYIGRVAPYKNLEALIGAIVNIKEKVDNRVTLTIAGSLVFSSYVEKLRKLLDKLDTHWMDYIEFKGIVLSSKLPILYSYCQIYCSPSKWEGFLKSDAYAYKKPMVAFDLTSGRDIIQDGKTGLLCNTGTLLEEVLPILLEDESLCRQFGEDGYKWAKEHLDMDKIVDNLEGEINGS